MSRSAIQPRVMSRRAFLGASTATGASLVLAAWLPPNATAGGRAVAVANVAQGDPAFEPSLWIRIDATGIVSVSVHRSEMGQRVDTALPMVVADELEADWEQVRVEHAPLDRGYGDQVTGGSASVSSSWRLLRTAAATARTMLVTAAAGIWGVEPDACHAEQGQVVHDETDRRLAYGDLVADAAALPVPEPDSIRLKEAADFRIIGGHVPDPNGPDYVTGRARYTCDIVLPGMLTAVVARPPTLDGTVTGFDPGPALAVEGVRHVVQVDTGVAVVADSTWAALQGRTRLVVDWDEGETARFDSSVIREAALSGIRMRDDPAYLEAVYEIPYLAHVPMEPMDCVADVRDDLAEVWAPTQDRADAVRAAARGAGVPAESVVLHVPLIGGAFGRRLASDFVQEACEISKAVHAPIRTFWTREDDVRHDHYHPFTLVHASAPRDLAGPLRFSSVEGWGPPTGAWRSVGDMNQGFAIGSFVDELATATGIDVIELYRQRYDWLVPVVELAASKAGWGSSLPDGWGRGLAAHSTFGVTPVAMVVEASVAGERVSVHRVVCAIDCGVAVDPGGVVAQMEGGIAFALSAALFQEVTLQDGRIQQSGFVDFPVLRMDEMPRVEVHLLASERDPSGVGEMAVPPTAPALMNAVFAATGRRIRHLPIRPEDLG